MALTSRITLTGPPEQDPEDFLSTSLGVIFPDDVMNQHGDADHGLLYTSPHLPRPLHLSLTEPTGDEDRRLFSHYLWNSSLLLAELIEAGCLGLTEPGSAAGAGPGAGPGLCPPMSDFDVRGLSVLELGAGTALPSLLGALLGARSVLITDYPSPAVLSNLRANVARNAQPASSPLGAACPVAVAGHSWGDLSAPPAPEGRRAYDRVLVCDCLWMPWQHDNLRASVGWFLSGDPGARAWVVAGFHTGREKMRGFFGREALAAAGLEVERMWERDCDGVDREWAWDRGVEDISVRKRWLVVAVLRRIRTGPAEGGSDGAPASEEAPGALRVGGII
ncbi:Protein N-methyltransferase NNT1 [Pleurostoma richardsiae]|uniref:Protein N-methyltransferase NNT1 n=1 Tax=Pleurostoma richardsiae TaxID=41990 RepID=A0AA38RXA1_9PEZI|nr:Protein N-methyltransferase NNT1 [Pleurostoma richardsiae]